MQEAESMKQIEAVCGVDMEKSPILGALKRGISPHSCRREIKMGAFDHIQLIILVV